MKDTLREECDSSEECLRLEQVCNILFDADPQILIGSRCLNHSNITMISDNRQIDNLILIG